MDSTVPSSTNGETEESDEKKAIAIRGDGDRIQRRCHDSDLEDIAINSMIDQVRRRDEIPLQLIQFFPFSC